MLWCNGAHIIDNIDTRLCILFTTEFISSEENNYLLSNHKNLDTWSDHASKLSDSRSSSSGFSNLVACSANEWGKGMATMFRCRRCSGRWSQWCCCHPLGWSNQSIHDCDRHGKVFQVFQCHHGKEMGRSGLPGVPRAYQVFQCQLDQLIPGQVSRLVLIQMWQRRCWAEEGEKNLSCFLALSHCGILRWPCSTSH